MRAKCLAQDTVHYSTAKGRPKVGFPCTLLFLVPVVSLAELGTYVLKLIDVSLSLKNEIKTVTQFLDSFYNK